MLSSTLRQFSIKQRLIVLNISALLGILVLFGITLSNTESNLYTLKKEENKHIVEVARSLVAHHYGLQQSGVLSEHEAQTAALAALQNLRFDKTNYFWVNDQTPTMIMHPIKPALDGKNIANVQDPNGKYLFKEMVATVQSSGSGFVDYQWPKPNSEVPADKISYVSGFSPWGWVIGSGMYLDDIEVFYNQLIWQLVLAITVIFSGLALFGWFISKSIMEPINNTCQDLIQISTGQWDLTKQFDETGKDEISVLIKHINMFTQKLHQTIQQMSSSSDNLYQSSANINQVTRLSKNLGDEQNNSVNLLVSDIDSIYASITDVSNSANDAHMLTKDAQMNTAAGNQSVNATLADIAELDTHIDSVNMVINQLASETQNIGTVLDVIRGIAEQTNLLALNAAIEAARAGEQGRGFAVVADEVRTLASRTSNSTAEIQTMIKSLQEGASAAVNAVQISKDVSAKTKEKAVIANQSLQAVNKLMADVMAQNERIVTSMRTQESAAGSLSAQVNSLADIAQKSVSSNEALSESSHALKTNGEQMQDVITQFKI